jgi:hypothetical protein
MRIFATILFVHLLPIVAVASIRRDAVIVNASKEVIMVCHVDGTPDKRIEPGKEERIVFPPSSEKLPIRAGARVYRYDCPVPPREFLKVGMFKSIFRVVLSVDQKLYLVSPDSTLIDAALHASQPNGWPLTPVAVEPNHTAEPASPSRGGSS